MADDRKPIEGADESRRTKLLKRSRDITDEVGGYIFVGGFPPSLIDELEARAEGEPEEPGDDPGPADGPAEPPGS